MAYKKAVIVSILAIFLFSAIVCAEEESQYRKFKFDRATCDVGIRYKASGEGLDIGVSAIALGKGANFRRWRVSDIRLHVAGGVERPVKSEKFFVNKESFFRVPAAVLFAVIGAMDPGPSGTSLSKGINRTGMAVGMGLLVLLAEGDIPGERCSFSLDGKTASAIGGKNDAIIITIENPDVHEKETIRIGITKPDTSSAEKDYSAMSSNELSSLVSDLGGKTAALEEEQKGYKYGKDPEYDIIQRKIESFQTERGLAYKALLEKEE